MNFWVECFTRVLIFRPDRGQYHETQNKLIVHVGISHWRQCADFSLLCLVSQCISAVTMCWYESFSAGACSHLQRLWVLFLQYIFINIFFQYSSSSLNSLNIHYFCKLYLMRLRWRVRTVSCAQSCWGHGRRNINTGYLGLVIVCSQQAWMIELS